MTYSKFFAVLAAVLMCSCFATRDSYFYLTPEGPAPSGGGMGIGVGPINMAEYLDRPNLVMAVGGNELAVADNKRWAGDLESSVARVMAANLGRQLGTGNVLTYPWKNDGGLRYQITLDIRQLHGTSDGKACLEAGWHAYSLPSNKIVAARTFNAVEPLYKDGYQALVAAESRLFARLAKDIAQSLR